ncbi:MAG TPA: HepT-like ribonuclease domain-containing protein [Thermoanaerobaculia bacterium]|nr:HepT-like ribonuclease domain-containing protein [Thermoanaerobaculia bacterium]
MRPPEIETRLSHIASACEKVLRVTRGLTYEQYVSHDLVPDVVERQLTIVGEAMTRVAKLDPALAARVGEYPRIIAFRNQIVHNYPDIDADAIWTVIQRDVPALLERVRNALGDLE